jgi:predicted DNA-binding transcriptional regulator AlpA
MSKALPYPPPWQHKETLAAHLSVSANTVVNWAAQGKLPPPRKIGGKVMWKWSEVDEKLTLGREGPDTLAERTPNGTRAAASEIRN